MNPSTYLSKIITNLFFNDYKKKYSFGIWKGHAPPLPPPLGSAPGEPLLRGRNHWRVAGAPVAKNVQTVAVVSSKLPKRTAWRNQQLFRTSSVRPSTVVGRRSVITDKPGANGE